MRWRRPEGGPLLTSARLVIGHDEPRARLELRSLLEARSHEVVGEAGDAESMRRLARQLQPDLVLLPPSLGEEESFATAEAIRAELDLPVFFLSETYDPTLLERAREAGCAGFLARPFTDAALE